MSEVADLTKAENRIREEENPPSTLHLLDPPDSYKNLRGFLCSYFLGTVIICGVTGNFLVLTMMPQTAAMRPKWKLFYTAAVASESAVLVLVYGMHWFSYHGLAYLTNSSVQWSVVYIDKVSVPILVCWDVCKSLSAYYLAAMSLERAIVAVHPPAVHLVTFKTSIVSFAAITVWCMVLPCVTTSFESPCEAYQQFSECEPSSDVQTAIMGMVNSVPLVVISGSLVIVPWKLVKRCNKVQPSDLPRGIIVNLSRLSRKELRQSVTVTMITTIYVLLVGLTQVLSLVHFFASFGCYDNSIKNINDLLQCVASISYAITGFMCLAILTSFRTQFLKTFSICILMTGPATSTQKITFDLADMKL